MRLHRAFGLVALLLLTTELSIGCPAHVQASNKMAHKSSVTGTRAYQPPKMGLPGRREGAGTR